MQALDLAQSIPGGPEELRARFETRHADYEFEETATETTHVVVCELESDMPRCGRVPVAMIEI